MVHLTNMHSCLSNINEFIQENFGLLFNQIIHVLVNAIPTV